MMITFFSFLMAVLMSNLMMIVLFFCCKSIRVVGILGTNILLFACGLCALRICLPIELKWTKEIMVPAIYNPIYDAVRTQLPNGITVWHVILTVWFTVSFCLLIRLTVQYRRYQRNTSKQPLLNSVEVMAAAKEVIPQPHLGQIKIVSALPEDVPKTLGIFRPVIAIPFRKYKGQELRLILLHEYTHIKNGDNLAKLILAVLRFLFWWCPAIHLFQFGFGTALEMRCDYLVTKSMNQSEMVYYLKTLAHTAFYGIKRKSGAVDSKLSDGKALLQRTEVLMRYRTKKRNFAALLFCILLSMSVFIGSYSIVFQTAYEARSDHDEQFVSPTNDFQAFDNTDGTYTVTMNGETRLWTEDEMQEFMSSFIDANQN